MRGERFAIRFRSFLNSLRSTTIRSCLLKVAPAVGFEDRLIQLVVELLEDGDEAVVVDEFVLGGERGAGADGGEDVVKAGESQLRMLRLLPLAVRVEPLAEIADALLERGVVQRRKRKRLEAAGFDIYRIVANAEPRSGRQRPSDMN